MNLSASLRAIHFITNRKVLNKGMRLRLCLLNVQLIAGCVAKLPRKSFIIIGHVPAQAMQYVYQSAHSSQDSQAASDGLRAICPALFDPQGQRLDAAGKR